MDKEYYKTLVLSGNSTNGIVSLGAVQYLIDTNQLTKVENYVGTSSGSIINSLLCVGYTPLEILEYVCISNAYKHVGKINIAKFITEGEGLFEFEKLKSVLEEMFRKKVGYIPTLGEIFEQFKKNFVCVTINYTTQKRIYISNENHPDILITDAVHMSSCFPVVFQPFEYKSEKYVDGGIGDNFPVKFSTKFEGKGVCVSIALQISSFENVPYFIRSLMKLILIHTNLVAEDQDVYPDRDCIYIKGIEPSFFDFSSSPLKLIDMFYKGYDDLEKQNSSINNE